MIIKKMNIKTKLILFVLAFSLIPSIYISFYVNIKISDFLRKQSEFYYSNLLRQISNNIDNAFSAYSIKISDVTKMSSFSKIINKESYQSIIDERFFLRDIGESVNIPDPNSMVWYIYTNINGLFAIIETDKHSIINDADYKVHYLINSMSGYVIDYDSLKEESLYEKMVSLRGPVLGKISDKSLIGINHNTVILYPYYHRNKDIPDVVLVTILYDDFIKNLINHPQLRNGTLYLTDSSNRLIEQTHPDRNDYYLYDYESSRYILNDDTAFNKLDMSFYDYQKLSTRASILNERVIKEQLDNIDEKIKSYHDNSENSYSNNFYTIKDRGVKYFFMTDYSINSFSKLIFLIPSNFVFRPVMRILYNIALLIFFLIVLTVVLTIWLSGHFTKPIISLSKFMVSAGKGELNIIEPVKTNDEIEKLYESYNIMIKDIVLTQGKIEAEEEELKITRLVAITALARLAEYRDESTGRHLERVSEYTRILASGLRKSEKYRNYLTDKYIEDIASSSVLHDIGKVGIENEILLKPGSLTLEEFEIIKRHTVIGGEALSNADKELGIKSFLTLAKEICYYHHEKYDGSGYPKGLTGNEIPLSARITAIADVYDALTSDRCYKKAMSHVEAADIIINKSSGHFDPDVVSCFIENQDKFIEIKNLYREGF